VVKANAYGHGIVECAAALVAEGASMLGVAIADEAIPLRDSSAPTALHTAPILVLTPPFADEADEYCRMNLAFTAASLDVVRAFDAAAKAHGCTLAAHLYLDTGLRRDGIEACSDPSGSSAALDFMRSCAEFTNIRFEGICTHFATADEREPAATSFLRTQTQRFQAALDALAEAGYTFEYVHAANSGAVAQASIHADSPTNAHARPHALFTLVRTGSALYGYHASDELAVSELAIGELAVSELASDTSGTSTPPLPLRPVLRLTTRIASVRRIASGESVSYGRTYVADRVTTIATLPIGYGDGLPRSLSSTTDDLGKPQSKLWCGVWSQSSASQSPASQKSASTTDAQVPERAPERALRLYPVVGRICMDECMLDCGDDLVAENDEVIIIGEGVNTAQTLAQAAGTIHYEILAGLRGRVRRSYSYSDDERDERDGHNGYAHTPLPANA
jgi:alanine racemase